MEQTLAPRPLADSNVHTMSVKSEAYSSGVSWPAVIGGAFVAASLSLILLTLGTGLGLSSVSPWSDRGATVSAIGAGAIVWLIVTHVLASAFGGYLAGRLRTKWTSVHTDEVFFRDTAHGLLVWAVGMVITAGFLTSAAASFAGSARTAPANAASTAGSSLDPNAYFVDNLLRSGSSNNGKVDSTERAEVERAFAHSLKQGEISAGDKSFLTQEVSARTGSSPADAEKRVSAVFAEAQQTADATRKAFAHLSLWLFVALLSGAFCASYAGTIGGRQRDHVPAL